MDEFSSIRFWTSKREQAHLWKQNGVQLSIGDDTAIVSNTNHINLNTSLAEQVQWLYTMDTMVEGVHFIAETMNYEQIGYKALASNVSDIAAMGGIPLHALVAISVPPHVTTSDIDLLYEGLYRCANQYDVVIVGGDTTSSLHSLTITVTLIGQVEQGRAIRRSGAKPGQLVVLTGVTGSSAAGLHLLQHPTNEQWLAPQYAKRLKQSHQCPTAHIEEGRILLQSEACFALNDVSDGLSSEAYEIAEASGVDIIIEEHKIPIGEALSQYAAVANRNAYDWILHGGEDYVLLATIERTEYERLAQQFKAQGKMLYEIGYVEHGEGKVWLDQLDQKLAHKERKLLAKQGYNHFD